MLDASLLVGVAERHASAVRFVTRLRGAVATSITFGEVLCLLSQRAGTPVAVTEQMFVSVLGVKVEPVDAAIVRHFPKLKRMDAASRAAQTGAGVNQVRSLRLRACRGGAGAAAGRGWWAAVAPTADVRLVKPLRRGCSVRSSGPGPAR